MLRASGDTCVFFFLLYVRRCFISFGFNHCLSQSRMYSILRSKRVDRESRKSGWITSPTALMHFSDDRHWRVNHCNTVYIRVCSNLAKILWFAMATKCAFRNVFFSAFFFIFGCTLFNFTWYFVTCC